MHLRENNIYRDLYQVNMKSIIIVYNKRLNLFLVNIILHYLDQPCLRTYLYDYLK